jgi:hypothetical protein
MVMLNLTTQGQLASIGLVQDQCNFLLANSDKFQSFIINPRDIDVGKKDDALRVDDEDITSTCQIKLLGVDIDNNNNNNNNKFIIGTLIQVDCT